MKKTIYPKYDQYPDHTYRTFVRKLNEDNKYYLSPVIQRGSLERFLDSCYREILWGKYCPNLYTESGTSIHIIDEDQRGEDERILGFKLN